MTRLPQSEYSGANVTLNLLTRSTATTFLAAATFYDLLRIFQTTLEIDVQEKIKYCKFHAARIIKAFKNGEDPNLFEPPQLKDPDFEDLKAEDDGELTSENTAENTAENNEYDGPSLNRKEDADVSGAFDSTADQPTASSTDLLSTFPSAPSHAAASVNPSEDFIASSNTAPSTFPIVPETKPSSQSSFRGSTSTAPGYPPAPLTFSPSPPEPSYPPAPVAQPRTSISSHHMTKDDVKVIMDETELMSTAQKHAKFAISALNYEDVPTAIKELQEALSLLQTYGN